MVYTYDVEVSLAVSNLQKEWYTGLQPHDDSFDFYLNCLFKALLLAFNQRCFHKPHLRYFRGLSAGFEVTTDPDTRLWTSSGLHTLQRETTLFIQFLCLSVTLTQYKNKHTLQSYLVFQTAPEGWSGLLLLFLQNTTQCLNTRNRPKVPHNRKYYKLTDLSSCHLDVLSFYFYFYLR